MSTIAQPKNSAEFKARLQNPNCWLPQEGPQKFAIQHAFIEELLYGGARGGGKSDFLLGDFAYDIPEEWGKYHKGILFRKNYPQLQDIIKRAIEIYPKMFPGTTYKNSGKDWTFPNGAELRFRHMENALTWTEYQGHNYTWIGFDEISEWSTAEPYLMMKATLRSAHNHPYKRIRSTANPGGAGHSWLKSYFQIDKHPNGCIAFKANDQGEDAEMLEQILKDLNLPDLKSHKRMRRMFVPSKITDNRILLENDPDYPVKLFDLGSADMVKAWLAGDWDIMAGAYFTEYANARHVLKPFEIPQHWTRFRSMDWGSGAPFAVYWFAVADGRPVKDHKGDALHIPRGALVVYREWYGCSKPNVGLKMTDVDIGKGIKNLESEDIHPVTGKSLIEFGVIDPSAATRHGAKSSVETYAEEGVMFTKGSNNRIAGWAQIRNRLVGVDGVPMIYFFDTCEHLIRTLPNLQHDRHKIEDVDTDNEDHAADALRYGCMAREWIRDEHRPETVKWEAEAEINKATVMKTTQTIDEMIHERRAQKQTKGQW